MSITNIKDDVEAVAIIGMAGRFPSAGSVEEFWERLRDGVECISFFTDEELAREGINPATLADPNYVKARAVLDNIDLIDAAFFNFSPKEAESMDPQQRFFLECAWEALENAGYDSERYRDAISVYAGVSLNSYLMLNLLTHPGLVDSVGLLQASIRNRTDHLAPRVAYKLDLKGPAVTVQTACSTSLVAVHLACQSLLNYQSDMALAGGVSIGVPKKAGYMFEEGGILSADGHCRAFDAEASGTVVGNGIGIVVLKRLSDALADGDQIHAVIKGSAINNDGSSKVGYTAPSVAGQSEVIAMAQSVAGVEPESISYVEAHGTGTFLGDPVEIAALTQVFRAGTSRKNFCALGSVKSNIGHLDTAAGVAGLIKTVLALKHEAIPPSLHFERPNPQIDFDNSPFFVNNTLSEWKTNGAPRRAGVSSFGIGGTNAHVVLEEAPAQEDSGPSRPSQLLLLSAKSNAALEAATTNLIAHLREHPEVKLADIAYTLQVGRRAFNHRRMVVCRDAEDGAQALSTLDPFRVVAGLEEPRERPVVFMFPGQGAQYANMGRELYEVEEVFRGHVDRCAEKLIPHLGFDLRELLFPAAERLAESDERLKQTAATQPALFVIEYALAQLLMDWGVRPQAMIGHSIGEYVAACLAGVLSLEDALRVVAARGRLMGALPGGSMLMVPLPEKDVRPLLDNGLSLAAVNAPSMCVVAGAGDAVAELAARLNARDVVCQPLHTSHAFHSRMMEPALAEFTAVMSSVSLRPPTLPFISNLTGTWIKAEEATSPTYWAQQLRETVRLSEGISELFKEADSILLEVGPGRSLMNIARWHPHKAAGQIVLHSLPHPDQRGADLSSVLHNLGRMWLAGVGLDWARFYARERRRRVPLPTYPFQRQSYWVDPQRRPDAEGAAAGTSLRKKANVSEWFYVPSWKRSVPPAFSADAESVGQDSCWVLFVDEWGLGSRITERLARIGCDAVTVAAGDAYADSTPGHFTINPRRPDDYRMLLDELAARGKRPTTVVHMWNVSPEGLDGGAGADSEDDTLQRGFYSLLSLAQAVGEQSAIESLRLLVVTSNMQQVTGAEKLHPEKSTVLGPCKVIPQEYQHITCRSVDLTLPAGGDAHADKLAELLLGELAADKSDAIVAYRHGQRWAQVFEPHPLEKPADSGARLRQNGVYLITGGLGGVGLVLAEHLARTVRARLALVQRSPLPPREEWAGWVEGHDENDATSGRIRRLQELESLGAEVLVLGADVSSREQMERAVAEVRQRFGRIDGVIHSAGVPGGGMIQLKTPERAADILAPKVQGARVLGQLFKDEGLDFMLLCSSRSALLGGFGQVDYSAGNAYLDAFAHHYAAETGTYTVSVDWDGWQDVGMLVNTAAQYMNAAAEPTPAAETGHPLLGSLLPQADGQEVYVADFSVNKQWILDEHRIGGTAVVPGVTYLEMARAAFEKHCDGHAMQMNDVFFISPMSIKDDEQRQVRFELRGSGDDFKFQVSSKLSSDKSAQPKWQEHAIGQLSRVPERAPRKFDVQELIARCNVREAIVTDEERDPDLGARWQNIQKVYIGRGEILVLFELDEVFAGDLEVFKLHPSLLDRAAGTGMSYFEEIEGLYLPFSYKRLTMRRPLTRKLYALIKYLADESVNGETVTFDVNIMDADGNELVEIDEFSEKRINDLTERIKARAEELAPARNAAAPEPAGGKSIYQESIEEGIPPRDGVDAFARILAGNVGAQVVVSTKDLLASIERANTFTEARVNEEIEKLQGTKQMHPRPEIASEYVSPRNEDERVLADILQEMLGVESVGIHDNFFQLGGDSVLAIQIIARANRAGLHLTPQQIFQHQTVAELAVVAKKTKPVEAEQGTVTGDVPLTPIQHWFLEHGGPRPDASGQAVMLETREELDKAHVEAAVRKVLEHHDALRLRFVSEDSRWRQWNAAAEEAEVFAHVDLASLPESEQSAAMGAALRAAQEGLDLARGPLAKFTYFDLGRGRSGRLLAVIHRLAADSLSWPILLADMETAYRQLQGGQPVRLPRKTTSFKHWAERVQADARSQALLSEADYWTDERYREPARLPLDYAGGENTRGSAERLVVSLGEDESAALRESVPHAYHVQLSDLLMTALAQAFTRWSGTDSFLASSEGPGRESKLEGIDLTRTVGWFEELFPVALKLKQWESPGQTLRAVKEQLRQVPDWGVGYGRLRYLSEDAGVREKLSQLPEPEVLLSFHPPLPLQLAATHSTLFQTVSRADGDLRDDSTAPRPYLLEVRVFESGGGLQAEWSYSANLHRRETIEQLAQEFLAALRELIARAETPDAVGYTPSDFPLAALNEEKLRKLEKLLEDSDA